MLEHKALLRRRVFFFTGKLSLRQGSQLPKEREGIDTGIMTIAESNLIGIIAYRFHLDDSKLGREGLIRG